MKKVAKILTILIIILLMSACKESIVHDLDETQANYIITRLYEAGIKAEKERQADGMWEILVDKDKSIEAISYLKKSKSFISIAPSAPSKSSVISSREDQRFHYERALSKEIETTLSSIDGVLYARVHLNLPLKDPLFGKPIDPNDKGSASVVISADKNFKIDKNHIAAVVSGASGIAPDKIAVLISYSNSKESKQKETKTIPASTISTPIKETAINKEILKKINIQEKQQSGLAFSVFGYTVRMPIYALVLLFLGIGLLFIFFKTDLLSSKKGNLFDK